MNPSWRLPFSAWRHTWFIEMTEIHTSDSKRLLGLYYSHISWKLGIKLTVIITCQQRIKKKKIGDCLSPQPPWKLSILLILARAPQVGISDSPRDSTGQLLLCQVQFICLNLLINVMGGVSQRFLLQDRSDCTWIKRANSQYKMFLQMQKWSRSTALW